MRSDTISLRQLMVILFVGMFSPVMRTLPRTCAQLSGRAAWVAPLAALIPVCIFTFICFKLFSYENESMGLADMMIETFGALIGRALAMFFCGFQIYYAGYIIRNSAERIVSTVYPDSVVWIFAAALTLLCLIASMGRLENLARTAEIFFLLMIGMLFFVSIFSIQNIKIENLLPVSTLDTKPVLKSTGIVFAIMSVALYSLFLSGQVRDISKNIRKTVYWMGLSCVIACLLIVITIGAYGAMIVAKTQQPFFVVIRDLEVFDILERIEAVVMAVWVVTDFVLISMLLMIAAEILKTVFSAKARKYFTLPVAGISYMVNLFVAPNAFELWNITTGVMTKLNTLFGCILVPAVVILRFLKKKKKRY